VRVLNRFGGRVASVPVAVLRHDRRRAAALVSGALVGAAVLALVDPAVPGRYPLCPSRALLGIDCPACGGLRGVHAALHGDVGQALDHNLLLVVVLPLAAAWLVATALPLVGRPPLTWRPPRWVVIVGVVVAATFAVARNLPLDALEPLASTA
jgi:hypothetical protein